MTEALAAPDMSTRVPAQKVAELGLPANPLESIGNNLHPTEAAMDLGSTTLVKSVEVDFLDIERQEVAERTVDTPLEWASVHAFNYLKGGQLATTLPQEVFKNRENNGRVITGLPATAVDALPAGNYAIVQATESGTGEFNVVRNETGTFITGRRAKNHTGASIDSVLDQVLASGRAKDTSPKIDFGKDGSTATDFVITADQMSRLNTSEAAPEVISVLEAAGFLRQTVGGVDTLLHPSPATLEKLIVAQNLPIKLIELANADAQIPLSEYFMSFAEGKFPVGTGDLRYYVHDTTNDHLPGVLAGGEGVMKLLAPIARRIMEQGRMDEFALRFDGFTSVITRLLTRLGESADGAKKTVDSLDALYQRLAIEVGLELEAEPGVMAAAVLDGILAVSEKSHLNRQFKANLELVSATTNPADELVRPPTEEELYNIREQKKLKRTRAAITQQAA